MFHLRCYTLRKFFPFMDAGFQREPMSVTFVRNSPINVVCFLTIPTISHIQGLFCLTYSPDSKPGVLLINSAKTTPPKSLHILQLNFQTNKSILAAAKVCYILSRNGYACKQLPNCTRIFISILQKKFNLFLAINCFLAVTQTFFEKCKFCPNLLDSIVSVNESKG